MTLQKDPEGTETRFLNQSAVFANQHVLEIGSSDGRLTWRYANSADRVTGIDLDVEALQTAAADRPANLLETVSFVRASVLNLPFPRNSFNIAILAWSF